MDLLDQLLMDSAEVPLGGPPMGSVDQVHLDRPVIQKVNYSHKAMIDLILASPGISQGAIAATFGYSQSWVSQVIASDAFQSALALRAKEVVDPTLLATVQERFEAIVRRSQDILMEKLSKPADVVPDQLAIAALQTASRARGYGAREELPRTPTVEVEVHLHQMGDRLTHLLQRKRSETLDMQLEQIAGPTAEG